MFAARNLYLGIKITEENLQRNNLKLQMVQLIPKKTKKNFVWHWTSASPECVTIFLACTTWPRNDTMVTWKIKRKSFALTTPARCSFVCRLSSFWLRSFYKINTEWDGEWKPCVSAEVDPKRRKFWDFVVWKVNLGEVNSAQFADFHFNWKFFVNFQSFP